MFALIDATAVDDQGTPDDFADDVPLENVASILFAEEQGSFLVGAAAALKSQTGTIGFIGGVEIDLIKKFEAGYIAGAQAVNPDIEILSQYITQPPDFNGSTTPPAARRSPPRCTAMAPTSCTRRPAAPASVSSRPPARPASRATVWAIGVDSDPYDCVDAALQPYILTSMLKKVDVAVFETIEALTNGEFRGGLQRVRPRLGRRRLLDVGWLRRRHRRPARRVQAADHRRRDRGPDDPVTVRSSR